MVNGVKEDYYPHNYSSAKGYTKDYRGMQRITNFKGNNYDANFYLYHSKNKTGLMMVRNLLLIGSW